MNVIYIVMFLLVAILVYFGFAIFISKTMKRKVQTQTASVEPLPVLPTVSEIVSKSRRSGHGLQLGNQRQKRKLFRQSYYLFVKYGKRKA